ncbi:hypothetical protein ABZT17_01060 [Streptomyces sp. NPDC005648]|uniref:hypothetical protein n=1 Tax=Streptomyces sp. NPDC005648 TaxID=3157044 RepID=UPI0033B9A78E
MSSRPPSSPRRAWRTTRAAVFLPALAALLATLVVCFGSPAPTGTAEPPVTAARATTVASPADCPHGNACCTHTEHAVRALPRTAPHPPTAPLPRTPPVPADAVRTGPLAVPTARGAPDLHVLQVLRT